MLRKIIIFYLVTCLGAGLMGGLQPHIGIDENVIQLTQLGPTFGVLVLLAIYRKNIKLAIGNRFTRPVLRRVVLGALIPLAAFGLTLLMYTLTGHGKFIDFTHPAALSSSPYWLIFVMAFVGASFEEIGWRSWLQPFLQTKYSVLSASLIVGVLWGLWHVGNFAYGPLFMGAFMIMAVAISVVMGVLLQGARRNNLIIATTVHAVVNIYLLLFFSEEQGNIAAMATIAAGWVIAALAVLALSKRFNQGAINTPAIAE